MLARAQLNRILNDESLTHSLGDEEASILVEWLADAADRAPPDAAEPHVAALYRRGRVLARVVRLWCYEGQQGAASQLAVCEGLTQALPSGPTCPYELMRKLIVHEAIRRSCTREHTPPERLEDE
jgi:hypothetical protein